ncbi:efflux RND transporter periplasmic adaptor subunit [Candidatus Chloroploca sp. Khr17]|uniref:efflux RND transporter periplasmic adaptor subunit n=1 Tax=Candidatus Chloroploca sp. Khr17 TaxID=2496869 RepID=UPI00101B9742|nr:efflux RND transporter periplasmic adaptor subunit [Candidatus Chloroploca sp. Khr17]
MSAASPTQRLAGQKLGRKARQRKRIWWLGAIIVVVAAGSFGLWRLTQNATTSTVMSTGTVQRGTLRITVAGSGTVEPAESRAVAFAVSGTIAEVLVESGDTVTAGQALAQLDTTELELAVRQAEANLASAQAGFAAANGEGATPEEVAAAETQLRSAQAQYAQTSNGGVTAAQLASAEAQLASAQANLATLLAGPTTENRASAQASVDQARLSLAAQRASLATAKTRAESNVTTAANAVRDAQEAYSTIYWQNRELEQRPSGLAQTNIDNEAAALRAVSNAEESLRQAQLAFEQAEQDEAIGLQQAEATLRNAEIQFTAVEDGATAAEIASARASVASAQANLSALRQPATAEQLTIAQASVEQAQLSLEQLSSPGSASSLANAAASLAQAEVALETAQLNRERATLVAPFTGVVADVTMNAGDSVSANATVTIIDQSTLYVDLSLSESDIADVAVGQSVELTFDALSDVAIEGTVERIAPVATVTSNVATYPVRVAFVAGEAPVKIGMSASGTIIIEARDDVVLVPSRAVQTGGRASFVQVQQAEGQAPVMVRVETGATSGGQTEIVRCLETGAMCLQDGDTLLMTTATSSSTTTNADTLRPGMLDGGGMGGPPPGMGR